ncbi:hypothetical protein H6F89_34140 [Cyanobacteria bacterium FACHB-63]|nr:hypothetical protein [Cyanobacteria bacterium FACHB-63]
MRSTRLSPRHCLTVSLSSNRHYLSLGLTDTITNLRIAEAKAKQIETQSEAIVGITAISRVTIAALEMNSPLQLAARQIWIRIGLFP